MFNLNMPPSDSPWSLPDPNESDDLAAAHAMLGAKMAIAQGQVTPEEAKARLEKHGFLPPSKAQQSQGQAMPAPDVDSQKYAVPGNAPSQGVDAQPSSADKIKDILNLNRTQNEDNQTYKMQQNSVKPTIMDPADAKKLAMMARGEFVNPQTGEVEVDPNNLIQQQMSGINSMGDLLKMQNDIQGRAPAIANTNLSGFARMADVLSSPQQKGALEAYAQSGMAPQGPEQMRDKFLAYQQKLQQDRRDLLKSQYEAQKAYKGGTISDLFAFQQLNKQLQENKDAPNVQGARNQVAYDRMDIQNHRQVVNHVLNDKLANKGLASLNAIDTALHNMATNDINPNLVHENQVLIRNAIQQGSGSRTGVDERAKTYVESLGMDWGTWKQFLKSDVEKMDPNDPIVQHFVNLSKTSKDVMREQFLNAINASASGFKSMYDRRPDLMGDIKDLVSKRVAQASMKNPTVGATSGGQRMSPTKFKAPAKPLEQMSNAELDAFIKANGGH